MWQIGRKCNGYHTYAAKLLISIRFAASIGIWIFAAQIFKKKTKKTPEVHFLKNSQTKTCHLYTNNNLNMDSDSANTF